MFCRKSFLVFLLAFAALTLGNSQEARAQCADDDWWCLLWNSPLLIDGGSKNLVYTCDEGQGVNRLILDTPDKFISKGTVLCDFTGKVKGTGIQCEYNVTWTKEELAVCTPINNNADALVTVQSKCDNPNVHGTLHCAAQGNFPEVTDLLGISSATECQAVFGTNANTLFSQATFKGQMCSTVLTDNTSLVLGGLTQATTNLCHSDGTDTVDCIVGSSPNPNPNNTNKSKSAVPNLAQTACNASPTKWNVNCAGNKDNGDGTFCFLGGVSNIGGTEGTLFSFDPNSLNLTTASLNGVPVEMKKGQPLCVVKDCNGDQIPDLQCTFPTCTGGQAIAAPPLAAALGELTMVMDFSGNTGGGLTCTTNVGTTGQ